MQAQFSLIVAVYNVEEYIGDFLESLERQTYGLDKLDIILVDDGSTDASGELARAWADRHPDNVTWMRQENAGQGAARNAGLEVAQGEWVTFCDPDDVLADDYFDEVTAFISAQTGPLPELIATRILTFTVDHLVTYNRHPLRSNFAGSNKLVDLSRFPERIHLSGGTSFLRRSVVEENGLRFDTSIKPTFEDGHFIGRYLLSVGTPLVGFVRTAEYYYRKRVDASSSVQSGWSSEDKYTTVLRRGYLDLLSMAAERGNGSVPLWLQNTILYDVVWYFRADAQITSLTGSIPAPVLAEFHELMGQILRYIDVETILSFRIIRADWALKRAIIAGYKEPIERPEALYLDHIDKPQRLVRARYLFSGELPDEEFRLRGLVVLPAHAKTRAITAYGRTLLFERIVWLPTEGTLRARVAGHQLPLRTETPSDPPFFLTPEELWSRLKVKRPQKAAKQRSTSNSLPRSLARKARMTMKTKRKRSARPTPEQVEAKRSIALARRPRVQRRYRDAWVLMDRIEQAQDNAEHFYRYLKKRRPEVNAWFVLDRTSPDWDRLRAEGFKLVAHNTRQWRALILNADTIVSSQANAFAEAPLPIRLYGGRRWRFVFLQHGVIKDDLSRWLNPKRIHLFVTSTEAERDSIAGDGSSYVFTSKEVVMTGLPRHDRLLKLADAYPAARRDRILVMPTWRKSLADAMKHAESEEERAAIFADSDFGAHWGALLHSAELRDLAAAQGVRICLLPHPNVAPFLTTETLPEHVDLLDWSTVNVQEEFARCHMLLTDYSSVAFDVALLGKPTVYFQFDEAAFFAGSQPFRRGYFEYERDGFGPVATTVPDCLASLRGIADSGFVAPEPYASRIAATFTLADGNACSRVFQAIRGLDRVHRPVTVEPGDVVQERVAP